MLVIEANSEVKVVAKNLPSLGHSKTRWTSGLLQTRKTQCDAGASSSCLFFCTSPGIFALCNCSYSSQRAIQNNRPWEVYSSELILARINSPVSPARTESGAIYPPVSKKLFSQPPLFHFLSFPFFASLFSPPRASLPTFSHGRRQRF